MRSGAHIIEFADEARARRLLMAPNATPIRQRKNRGRLVGIDLADLGASKEAPRYGNPLKYSHNSETQRNPPRVWTLKTIPESAADIFDEVANGCKKYCHPTEFDKDGLLKRAA